MIILAQALFVSLVLLVWFKTQAFIEYCGLLRIDDKFKIPEFKQLQQDGANLEYTEFIVEYYNSFITRLITCPICLSVWTGSLVSVVCGNIWAFPIIILLGLLVYLITIKLL